MIRQVLAPVYFCSMVMLATMSMSVHSEDDSPEEAAAADGDGTTKAPAIYLPIKPAFVVNYGGKGRLKYIKTELSVRLENTEAANSVRHHLPLIRNNLVMLFSSQTDQSIGSQDGQEALRQDILQEIQRVVSVEDGIEGVKDVFFTTFFVQR